MKRGFKPIPVTQTDLDDAQMMLEGTYWKDEKCADFFYEDEHLAEESVDNDTPDIHTYDNEYFDKRLKDDFHKKYLYVVCGILGNTETHYVQPVRTVSVFETKHEAMQCVRASLIKLRLKMPTLTQTERYDFADYTEIRLDGYGEVLITVHKVLPGGFIDIDRL